MHTSLIYNVMVVRLKALSMFVAHFHALKKAINLDSTLCTLCHSCAKRCSKKSSNDKWYWIHFNFLPSLFFAAWQVNQCTFIHRINRKYSLIHRWCGNNARKNWLVVMAFESFDADKHPSMVNEFHWQPIHFHWMKYI